MKRILKNIIVFLMLLFMVSCTTVEEEINFPPPKEKDMTVGQNGLTEEDYWNLGGDILLIEDIIGHY